MNNYFPPLSLVYHLFFSSQFSAKRGTSTLVTHTNLISFDSVFIDSMKKHGIFLLRISLAIVFIWFGLLKIFNVSPVIPLITNTYPLFPEPFFITFLGLWEVLIGIGLLFKVLMRFTLALLWLQMGGIFFGFLLSPTLYFLHGNPFLLSTEGEFVIKNFVLVAASIVVGGNEVKRIKNP